MRKLTNPGFVQETSDKLRMRRKARLLMLKPWDGVKPAVGMDEAGGAAVVFEEDESMSDGGSYSDTARDAIGAAADAAAGATGVDVQPQGHDTGESAIEHDLDGRGDTDPEHGEEYEGDEELMDAEGSAQAQDLEDDRSRSRDRASLYESDELEYDEEDGDGEDFSDLFRALDSDNANVREHSAPDGGSDGDFWKPAADEFGMDVDDGNSTDESVESVWEPHDEYMDVDGDGHDDGDGQDNTGDDDEDTTMNLDSGDGQEQSEGDAMGSPQGDHDDDEEEEEWAGFTRVRPTGVVTSIANTDEYLQPANFDEEDWTGFSQTSRFKEALAAGLDAGLRRLTRSSTGAPRTQTAYPQRPAKWSGRPVRYTPLGLFLNPNRGDAKHRNDRDIEVKEAVRLHCLTLTGRESGESNFKYPAPTRNILNLFNSCQHGGPVLNQSFSPDVVGTLQSSWNLALAKLFADYFLRVVDPQWGVTKQEAKHRFLRHLPTLITQYRKLHGDSFQGLTPRKIQTDVDVLRGQQRTRRVETHLKRSAITKKFPKLQKLRSIVDALGSDGGSDDESQVMAGQSAFMIQPLLWRAPALNKALRTGCLLHLTNRFNDDGRPSRGAWPRLRLPPPPSTPGVMPRKPISGLPRNCYNPEWLKTLDKEAIRDLNAKEEVDLSVPEELRW
ncbi:hypothetical protein PENSPDRAFT_672576 [Peniophora sp. CONT]|nr:hypothetical protein PENSPDRAFT_672576 [Peniophora sp. CONT]